MITTRTLPPSPYNTTAQFGSAFFASPRLIEPLTKASSPEAELNEHWSVTKYSLIDLNADLNVDGLYPENYTLAAQLRDRFGSTPFYRYQYNSDAPLAAPIQAMEKFAAKKFKGIYADDALQRGYVDRDNLDNPSDGDIPVEPLPNTPKKFQFATA